MCVNALSGLYLISTLNIYTIAMNANWCQCPLGLIPHFYRITFLMCFVNRKSSKSEGKFPTFRSGNPHYPKETCREFSFFPLSSRKESSIHCFLPNRVIRVRLCQRLPERFAFNVLSFDSAPAPG